MFGMVELLSLKEDEKLATIGFLLLLLLLPTFTAHRH